MNKIILSLSMIAFVAAIAIVGTTAYFSDTEKSTGNTFSAGIIDISVDGENPWESSAEFKLEDLKPCETKYIEFDIKNEGTNPVVVRKHIGINSELTGIQSEPECDEDEEDGTWDPATETCSSMANENNKLSEAILYDMELSFNGETPITLIPEDWGIKVDDIQSLWIPLGTLVNKGDTVHVKQSYHLAPETTNWAQGDIMNFNIDLYGEQKGGSGPTTIHGVVLENKDDVDWYVVIDDMWGIFLYDSSTHDYTFRGFGLENGTSYRLTHRQTGDPADLIDGIANADGTLTLSGNHDFGSMTNVYINLMYGTSLWGSNLENLWDGNPIDF